MTLLFPPTLAGVVGQTKTTRRTKIDYIWFIASHQN